MRPLQRLMKSSAERKQTKPDAAIADPIIDRLVAKTERRLAYVSGYRDALRAPVIAARERMATMIARIPGPIEVSPANWSQDAALRPLFAHAADAAAAYSEDDGVRAFFGMHPGADCFGMLALEQSERRVLATVQHGESMQAEVARTTVSFGEPQILAPGADEGAVRGELALRALEYLALRALEEVGTMRADKRELERERSMLRAQLQLAERRGTGFGAIGSHGAQTSLDIATRAALERDLARTASELEDVASRNLLPVLLEALLAALARPEEHVTIEACTLALDPMNFAIAPGPQAVTPRVAMLKLARRGPFAVLLARFPRADLRANANRLADAAKYL
jgi:hypothetical protein